MSLQTSTRASSSSPLSSHWCTLSRRSTRGRSCSALAKMFVTSWCRRSAKTLGHRPKSSRKQHGKSADSPHHVRKRETGEPRHPPQQSTVSTDSDGIPKDLGARFRRENRCFRCKKAIGRPNVRRCSPARLRPPSHDSRFSHTGEGVQLDRGRMEGSARTRCCMGNGNSDSGSGVDWRNSLRQTGTEVGRRRSPRRAGPHQQGNSKGKGVGGEAHST